MQICRKLFPALWLPALLVACGGDGDPRLQGTWRSDKALTLAHLSPDEEARLTSEQRQFLARNLGDMQLHFDGAKVAVSFASQAGQPVRWDSYRWTTLASDAVGVETSAGGPVAYTFAGNCFHMQAAWGYREYFCRVPTAGG